MRLLLGIVFININVFAVWAPSMIGEGVNALNARTEILVPLLSGSPWRRWRIKKSQCPRT